MSAAVTAESLRAHAEYAPSAEMKRSLHAWADSVERESKLLPTVPGWYPSIVVERGGESCTGALLTDEEEWRTARPVSGEYGHCVSDTPRPTIRWAEQEGTPTLTEWKCPSCGETTRARMADQDALTLTPVGEHPEPGTRGLLPVGLDDGEWGSSELGMFLCLDGSTVSRAILVDPRPDGAM